jgi:hypothetical protein
LLLISTKLHREIKPGTPEIGFFEIQRIVLFGFLEMIGNGRGYSLFDLYMVVL